MKREGVWRKVISVKSKGEEHVGRRSWWLSMVHTVTLECGHQKVYRNRESTHNLQRALCKQCKEEE